MRTFTTILILGLIFSAAIHAQDSRPKEPSPTAYVDLLAKAVLVEGVGFPGVCVLGAPYPEVHQKLGNGREDFDWTFFYFFDEGPWKLTVVGEMDEAKTGFYVHAIIVAGEKAPKTKLGVAIGDTVEKVKKLYGTPAPFTASIRGQPRKGARVRRMRFGAGGGESNTEMKDPPAFDNALWFPKARFAFAIADDKVEEIAMIVEDDPLPRFLRPKERVRGKTTAVTDAGVDHPTKSDDSKSWKVPPPPVLETFTAAGISLLVPKGATKTGMQWTLDKSAEAVTVESRDQGDETAESIATEYALSRNGNLVPEATRTLPREFTALSGAESGVAVETRLENLGKEGMPLDEYAVVLVHKKRVWIISVSRTVFPNPVGSPDLDDMARAILRSVKFTP